MRTELVHGRHILCGVILPISQILPNQQWAAASGNDRTVTIASVTGNWIEYSWNESTGVKWHEKDAFSFQCRYCLILPSAEIPEALLLTIETFQGRGET